MKENEALNCYSSNSDLLKRDTLSNNNTIRPILIKKNRIMQKSLSSQAFFDSYCVQNVDPIDLENLNENINKSKKQYQTKNKELFELKTSYQQLKNQSYNHIRVIEAILCKNNKISKSLSNISSPLLEQNNLNESSEAIVIQPTDSKLVSNLKNHLIEAKAELNEWLKEYEIVNQSEKVIQMRESEKKLEKCEETIRSIEYNSKQLQNNICEIHRILTDSINTEVNYKSNSIQMQLSIRDANNQLEILKTSCNTLEISISQHEQTMEKNKIDIIQLIEQIKQREELIEKCNEHKIQIEGLKNEKANYERRMNDIKKKLKMIVVDIEKAQKKKKDQETNKEYLTQKINYYEQERPKFISYSKDSVLSYRDKDKKIKELQRELNDIGKNKQCNNKKKEENLNEMNQQNEDSKEQIESIQRELNDLSDNTKMLKADLLNKKKELKVIEQSDMDNIKLILELNENITKAQCEKQSKPKEEYIALIIEKKSKFRLIEEEVQAKKNNENTYNKDKSVVMTKINEKNKHIKSLKEQRDQLEKQKAQLLLPSIINHEEFKDSFK